MDNLELPFDQYTRSLLIKKLVDGMRDKHPLKILDVGGRSGNLSNFLPQDKVYVMDILLPENYPNLYYLQADILNSPLKKESFDIVVSTDVYEHISPQNRLLMVSEMLRLSRNYVILAAPFYSEEIQAAEKMANEFFLKITGKIHPWLGEHINNGLPSEKEVENFLSDSGYKFRKYGSNNISIWTLFQLFIFCAYRCAIPSTKVNTIYKYYNENYTDLGDSLEPTYRKFYFIGKHGKLSPKNILQSTSADKFKLNHLSFLVFDAISAQILNKEAEIQSHLMPMQQLTQTVTRDAQRIKQLSNEMHTRDERIQQLYNEVRINDEQIQRLHDEMRISGEQQIRQLNNEVYAKGEQIRQLNNELHARNMLIQQIMSGIVMRLMIKCGSVIEKIFPPGTQRNHCYQLFLKGVHIIANEGWKSFWEKSTIWIRSQKGRPLIDSPYDDWIVKNEPSMSELEKQKTEARSFEYRPKISIVMPVWNTDKKWLVLAIESVLAQTYDNWELCIADGASDKKYIKKILQEYKKRDSRIKVKFLPENKGIGGNSNEALSLASGEFIGLLDHDDELRPHALYEVVKLLNEKANLGFIYSDEDKIDRNGRRVEPFFKPDWSPDLFMSMMYTCHFCVIRADLVNVISGFREQFNGSQDYDLVLRVTEKTNSIGHIPKVLYSWRKVQASVALTSGAKPYAFTAGLAVLQEALNRRGLEGEVAHLEHLGHYRIRYKIKSNPLISIIIPNLDHLDDLSKCISSLLEKSTYNNYEIIIVDTGSSDKRVFSYYENLQKDNVKILEFKKPFNFSALHNFAVQRCQGEFLILLNNDTEVITNNWIEELLMLCQCKDVGAVGAKLIYPDNRIQHAGVILGIGGIAGHSHKYYPANSTGYLHSLLVARNYSAVTAACMMIKKNVFNEVGGFDENLRIAFNDVDFCLKIRAKNYLIVWTPFAELYHHESKTRGYEDDAEKQLRFAAEIKYMENKWGSVLEKDPYYNPNLTLVKEDFSIKI